MTFPRSLGQVPIYYNAKNTGRPLDQKLVDKCEYQRFRSNYMDECNTPLYPFGYGLSYTKFAYSNLRVISVKAGEPVKVVVDVMNTGEREGDEVVQVYLSDVAASAPVPIRTLVGFERFSLRPREKRTVTFTITPRQMSLIDNNDKRVIEPGEFRLHIGGNQTSGLNGHFLISGKSVLSVAD